MSQWVGRELARRLAKTALVLLSSILCSLSYCLARFQVFFNSLLKPFIPNSAESQNKQLCNTKSKWSL